MKKIYLFITLFFYFFLINQLVAKEVLVYADSIKYDSNKNLVAKGNVKIYSKEQILTSQLIVINENEKKITLPVNFKYIDEEDNYYFGTSGEFTTDFEDAKIQNLKILLNDGSRIVGDEGYKKGKIDLINKGVYSPCKSKIKIKTPNVIAESATLNAGQ